MPWFEFECETCRHHFEEILGSHRETDRVKCPKCADGGKPKKLISGFRIAGKGDLRESSQFHGCHHAISGHHESHVHGPGCGHGSASNDSKKTGTDSGGSSSDP